MAGATYERRLLAVACTPWFGPYTADAAVQREGTATSPQYPYLFIGQFLDVHFVTPAPVPSPGNAGLQPGPRSHAGAWRSQEKPERTGSIFMKQTSRRLSEKKPVDQSIVAVGQMKGDNNSSLLSSLLSRSCAESDDERTLEENVPALGTPALPAGGP